MLDLSISFIVLRIVTSAYDNSTNSGHHFEILAYLNMLNFATVILYLFSQINRFGQYIHAALLF